MFLVQDVNDSKNGMKTGLTNKLELEKDKQTKSDFRVKVLIPPGVNPIARLPWNPHRI